jgi:hypothetical protein
MPSGDGSSAGTPSDVVRALAVAIRDDDRPLDRFLAPGFELSASIFIPGTTYTSLDERFDDLRREYDVVQVLPDPETVRELADGRIGITGEAHLTHRDGAGVSSLIVWLATVQDGLVVRVDGLTGPDEAERLGLEF